MPTAGEMIQRVRDNVHLSGAQAPMVGEILRRLEVAQQRCSQALQIPKRYIKDVDATQAFNLPTEARPTGLHYAEVENDNDEQPHTIPLMTVQEANDLGINWDTTDSDLSAFKGHPRYGKKLIIYDPANISAPVYPLGFESGDTLRMLYTKKPSAMSAMDDEPFDGEIPEYAFDILTQYVTFEILMANGMEQSQAYYNDYTRLMEMALAYSRPPLFMPRNIGVEAPD